jgi:prevent-host-death family protein
MPKPKKTIPAGEFKAKCLQIMDEVQATKKAVVVTKHGKPVVQIVPIEEKPSDFFGCMQGSVRIIGDIVGPVGIEWEATRDD